MNYTLHQLQVFLRIVRLQSVTRAAEELHMSQPAASIQLRNFQEQFDIPLTEVLNKRLYVTDFGREIAQIAENVLIEADAIRYKSREYKGLIKGKLRIASASTGKYVIPYFLSGFLHQNSGIDLVLDVTNKNKVLTSLKQNDIDFAFVSVLPEGLDVQEEILMENKLYLVGKESSFQKEQPLIFREKGSATRIAMDQYFNKAQSEVRKRLELTSNEAVKQAVLSGLGYSILPLIGIKHELSAGEIHIIPSRGLPLRTQWRTVWLRKKKLSPVAESFLSYLRTNKEKIIQSHFQWYLEHS